MTETATGETPKERLGLGDRAARRDAEGAAVFRHARFRRCHARLSRHAGKCADHQRAGQGGLEPRALRLSVRGEGAADGRSQPVAAVAAQHEPRAVRGGARRLPDPRARHRQHDADRGRQRRHRGGYADLDRRRARGDGALFPAPRQAAGRRRDLHPHPYRPLGRRARRARRRHAGQRQACRSSRPICSWSMRSRKTSSPGPRCCGARNISSGRSSPRACAGRSIAGSASRWRRARWRCCARPI